MVLHSYPRDRQGEREGGEKGEREKEGGRKGEREGGQQEGERGGKRSSRTLLPHSVTDSLNHITLTLQKMQTETTHMYKCVRHISLLDLRRFWLTLES